MTILLKITGRYGASADAPTAENVWDSYQSGPQGVEDEDGVEHYDDEVSTPFGPLGNLVSHVDGDEVVIDAAPGVVLISRRDDWDDFPGVSVEPNPFGFHIFELAARNGFVRYRLYEDEVRWADRPDEPVAMQIGVRTIECWTPEGPPPPRLRSQVITKVIQEAT